MGVDPRFLASSGREIYTGNELLVKGALEVEGGVHLMTGYPGSPISGFFDTLSSLKDLLMKQGVRAFQSNNEALAVAAANGSQMAPCRTIVAFKNVGTHVASDALALANLAGAHPEGGAIIISGEDPWCDSTQVPADSRFLFEHLRMPVIEPGTAQQLKDWIGLSFKLSQVAGLYIGYIVTTANADGGGTVQVSPNHWPELNTKHQVALDTNSIPVDRTVLLPPRTWMRELEVPERFARTITAARVLGVNQIQHAKPETAARLTGGDGRQPIGFITTGLAKGYLEDVLSDLGLSGDFPILNFGMSYPIDVKLVSEFADTVRTMVVVEERRSFLERNIRDAVFQQLPQEQATDINSRLFGKKFPGDVDGIPSTRGLYVSVLAQHIIPLLRQTEDLPHEMRNGRLSAEMERIRKACKTKLNVIGNTLVARTPTFCPGCPHRDSSATLLEVRKNFADPEYMKRVHNRGPVDMVAHGDTGCYTMLMFQPTESLMHNYSGMGLGGGTGSGIDPFITNKQIVFMGDGTFFHSGQIAISNAVKASQDITFIILENGTTAMTGHQEHAGTEVDLLGNRSYIQDISEIVRGMAGTSPMTVVKLRPDDRSKYKETLEKTILADGVKVIIADKECGITANRTISKQERKIVKEHGYLPRKTHMNVTPEVCEHCLECTKQTACPGLTTIETDYGRKIDTDLTWCVNDGACERVRTSNDFGTSVKPCPSFEQVTVVRKRRRRYTLPHLGLDKLPDPVRVHDMEQAGASWRVHMAGVGGMGIGVVGAILSRAGHKEGYHVAFQDKKGLAIRNGGVFSQITFLRDEQDGTAPICTGNIPYGKADLLLGIDILEAARAIDPRQQFRIAATDRTAAVLNLYKQPTVALLLGKEDFDIDVLRDEIFQSCKPELSFARNLSDLCERRLGTKQFANIMMLGVAYQLGLIPVSAHSIAWAIKDSIRRDQRKNIKAFDIGRKLALDGRALPNIPHPDTWAHLVTNKSKVLRKTRWGGRKLSQRYEQLVQGTMKQMRDLPEQGKYDIALRIYDLMQYDTDQLSRQYIEQVRQIYRRDSVERKFAATMAAIRGIAKVTLIKDEPYVAYLLTRYEKKQRDILKYNVDVSNGDRLVYRHHTSPEFNIGKYRVRLKITTTDWQLKLAASCKWWRKLPGWHKREVAFREWYNALPARLRLEDDAGYAQAVRILKCVDEVSGYREVRYPKMESVRRWVEAELGGTGSPSAQPATVEALV